jgi:hypothetical protein
MFGFFKKRPPPDPPTDKQRKYAARLGLAVTAAMSKTDVSAAISQAERKNPRAAVQRERVKQRVREQKLGPELIAQESHWNTFADEREFMLAIYRSGKATVVDVLCVNGAFVTEKGKLRLDVAAPKRINDPDIGEHLDWDRGFELPVESLLYHEPLQKDFYRHDSEGFAKANRKYQQIVENGLKIARKL